MVRDPQATAADVACKVLLVNVFVHRPCGTGSQRAVFYLQLEMF